MSARNYHHAMCPQCGACDCDTCQTWEQRGPHLCPEDDAK
jgi:hypothetical protein